VIWIALQLSGSALLTAAGVAAARRSLKQATGLVDAMLSLILLKNGLSYVPEGEPRFLPWDWYPLVERWWFLYPGMLIFGVGMGLFHQSMWKRDVLLIAAGLLLLHCAAVGWVMGRPSDLMGTVRPDGVCLQTSGYSCSAAAAASLLHLYGVAATEREMAELCVTCNGGLGGGGTTHSGILRGLRIKLGDAKRVRVARPTYETLPQPSMVGMKLSPTLTHSILVLRVTPTEVSVMDPLHGRGTMRRELFEREWLGSAIWAH
jgi:predicted double-glycine peptidase